MQMYAIALIFLLVIAPFAFFFSRQQAHAEPSNPGSEGYAGIISEPLTRHEFWAIIDHSAQFEADPEMQLADLHASFLRLSPGQIADFEQLFDETMQDSYSWDLWGAAYVANGSASDDGFEYFRCWLISKGRRVFEQVAADPDSLADLIAEGESGDFEFEEFAYVARDAWSEKSGADWNEMPVMADMCYDSEPKGTFISEEPKKLQIRYPKLWRRFGG